MLLRLERLEPLRVAALHLLVEARILDGDCQLRGERGHQRELVGRQRAPARRVQGEQTDQIFPNPKRQPDGGLDPRFRQLLADRSEAEICLRVVDQDRLLPPERPASELDQALGDPRVGAGQATARGLEQAIFVRLEQVEGEPLAAVQPGAPLDWGLEGAGPRQRRYRTTDGGYRRTLGILSSSLT